MSDPKPAEPIFTKIDIQESFIDDLRGMDEVVTQSLEGIIEAMSNPGMFDPNCQPTDGHGDLLNAFLSLCAFRRMLKQKGWLWQKVLYRARENEENEEWRTLSELEKERRGVKEEDSD